MITVSLVTQKKKKKKKKKLIIESDGVIPDRKAGTSPQYFELYHIVLDYN